jgi:hypothetical protein
LLFDPQITGEMPLNASELLADYVPEADLATTLGWAYRSFVDLRHKGKAPAYVKVGRRVFYHRDAIEAWLKDKEVDRSPKAPKRRS